MAIVTQTIPNFLGGVSKQSDIKKSPGQLTECLNAYPDPTFGLCKRSGTKWVTELGTTTDLADAEWFYIHRDRDELYVGCITTKPDIKIWNVKTGAPCTVTQPSLSYLTPIQTVVNTGLATANKTQNYHVLTVQDVTIITNRNKTAEMLTPPSYTSGRNVTIQLNSIQYDVDFTVIVNGQTFVYTTRASSTVGTLGALTYDEVLNAIKLGIDALAINGLTVTKVDGSIELVGASVLSVTAYGGVTSNSLVARIDVVNNIAELPVQSINGRIFKILNTTSDADDYWVKFVPSFGSSGTGIWEETRAPDASAGLNAATMPHQLVNTATNVFEFKAISWENRLAGNNTTNPVPSFIGNKIQFAVFVADRLGFISENNLILSQTNDYFNFFAKTSRIQIDSDPIDVSAGDSRPTLLFAALQITQGLLLFSENAQFLLTIDGSLTPTNAVIKRISNYQVDSQVFPLDNGSEVVFISKTLSYTRVFKLATQGENNNPQVLEISRVVMEWLPNNIDEMMVSADNSFIGLSSSTSDTAYFYRTYNNGEKDLMQSWFQWQLPGSIQFMDVDGDIILFITEQNNKATLSIADLNQTNQLDMLVGSRPEYTNPSFDFYTTPTTVTYNSASGESLITLPYTDVTARVPRLLVVGDASVDLDTGFTLTPTRTTTANQWRVSGVDLTSKSGKLLVGYDFNMEVGLPTTYFKRENNYDYTAPLTIARYKFHAGISGVFTFQTKRRGSDTWEDIRPTISANYYLANDAPIENEMILEIPIHQKNNNFSFRIKSDSPFLTTLNGMMWEGNYSPRYYKRVG